MGHYSSMTFEFIIGDDYHSHVQEFSSTKGSDYINIMIRKTTIGVSGFNYTVIIMYNVIIITQQDVQY